MKFIKKLKILGIVILALILVSAGVFCGMVIHYILLFSQMKDGGYVNQQEYLKYFCNDKEIIDYFIYKDVPVYITSIIDDYYPGGWLRGHGIFIDQSVYNLRDTEDKNIYYFILNHEYGHSIDTKTRNLVNPLALEMEEVIKLEAFADAFSVSENNLSLDQYREIRYWIQHNSKHSYKFSRERLDNINKSLIDTTISMLDNKKDLE